MVVGSGGGVRACVARCYTPAGQAAHNALEWTGVVTICWDGFTTHWGGRNSADAESGSGPRAAGRGVQGGTLHRLLAPHESMSAAQSGLS